MDKILKSIIIGLFYMAYDVFIILLSFHLVYQVMMSGTSANVDRVIVLLPIVSVTVGLLTVILLNTIGWLTATSFSKVCPAVCLMGLVVFFYGYSQYLVITVMFSVLIVLVTNKIIKKEIKYGKRQVKNSSL